MLKNLKNRKPETDWEVGDACFYFDKNSGNVISATILAIVDDTAAIDDLETGCQRFVKTEYLWRE